MSGPASLRWASLALALTGLAAGAAWFSGIRAPERWNPWAPLRVVERPNLLTPFKLARLSNDAPACFATLAQSGFRYEPVPDTAPAPGCGLRNAVQLRATQGPLLPALPLSCRAAVALALWERHTLLPAAERHFGVPLQRIEHWGSYACRNVYGRAGARRSGHATADAIDVSGFVLEDGRRVRVAADWEGKHPAARAFLREAHAGACRSFDGALGPAYNAAHADHLHLETGGFRVCR